jgi:hypothetical protein
VSEAQRKAAGRTPARKVHSIFGLLVGREFQGELELPGIKYRFIYAPRSVAVSGGRIEMTGPFSLVGRDRRLRRVEALRAILAATQGGVGTAAPAPEKFSGRNVGNRSQAPEKDASNALPITEATDERGFVAALYFQLAPIDADAFGLPADLSRVQLNARIAPTSAEERDLQWLISAAVAALADQGGGQAGAAQFIDEINGILKA